MRPSVGIESKTKQTKAGEKEYRYYRCSRYNAKDHPSIRINETKLDEQVLDIFDTLRIEDPKIRAWVVNVLQAKTKGVADMRQEHLVELQRQQRLVQKKLNRFVELFIADDIDKSVYQTKQAELQQRRDDLALQIEAVGRQGGEHANLAVKVFELSQSLKEKWLTADIFEKRRLLEILCLNWTLDGVSLVGEMRKPFDVLVKGLSVQSSRGDWI